MDVAAKNPLCLEEPAPLLIGQGFGASSIDYQFSVWAKTERFLEVRNSIQAGVKAAFDREGIEIPFPHQSLYAGIASEPLPIRLIHETAAAGPSGPEEGPEPPDHEDDDAEPPIRGGAGAPDAPPDDPARSGPRPSPTERSRPQ